MLPEVECTKCGWEGETEELDFISCPKCGSSKDIEDIHKINTPLYSYFKEFNWNRK